MKNLFVIILLFIQSGFLHSQIQFIFFNEVASFNQAEDFVKNPLNFFYVTDLEKNQIVQLNSDGNIINKIGGFGWDNYSFSDVTDIYENSLNIIICDRDNGRIIVYDKDLNYLWEFDNKRSEENFRLPISCAIDKFGNIFILDDENKNVLKFNSRGELLLEFGGFSYQEFSLRNPKKILINDQNIFVLDENHIFIFDEFGNGLNKIQLNETFTNFNIAKNILTLNNDKIIFIVDLNKNIKISEIELVGYKFEDKIKQTLTEKDDLYILTEKDLLKFKTKKAE